MIKDLFSKYSKKKSPGNVKVFVSLEELMVNNFNTNFLLNYLLGLM